MCMLSLVYYENWVSSLCKFTTMEKRPPTFVLYLGLALAVCMCSSAGTAFLLISEVPPILRAAWRLWCHFFVQIPICIFYERGAEKRAAAEAAAAADAEAAPPATANSGGSALILRTHTTDEDPLATKSTDATEIQIELAEMPAGGEGSHRGDAVQIAVTASSSRSRGAPAAASAPPSAAYFSMLRVRKLPLMAFVGLFLGLHFGAWVWSLEHTSLAHSLMWVSTGPIVLNGGHWIIYGVQALFVAGYCIWCERCASKIRSSGSVAEPLTGAAAEGSDRSQNEKKGPFPNLRKPSTLETGGAIIAVLGGICMSIDSISEEDKETTTGDGALGGGKQVPVSLLGDFVAFLGAIFICVYLLISKDVSWSSNRRNWPVTDYGKFWQSSWISSHEYGRF